MRSKLSSQQSDVISLPSVFSVDIRTDVKKAMTGQTSGNWALADHGSGPSSENTMELPKKFVPLNKGMKATNTRPCIVLVNTHMSLKLFCKWLTGWIWVFSCLIGYLIKTKRMEPVALEVAGLTKNKILAQSTKLANDFWHRDSGISLMCGGHSVAWHLDSCAVWGSCLLLGKAAITPFLWAARPQNLTKQSCRG